MEFPDLSGTPLACPGATTRGNDPVLEKTIACVALNPIPVDQVWARGIQQGGHISLGPFSISLGRSAPQVPPLAGRSSSLPRGMPLTIPLGRSAPFALCSTVFPLETSPGILFFLHLKTWQGKNAGCWDLFFQVFRELFQDIK